MQYLLLIYADEKLEPKPGTPEFDAHINAYMQFGEQHQQQIVGGNALTPIATATTVRNRNGKAQAIDGPFAETKEQLGGYYLVDCEDLDEAIAIAGEIPSGTFGSVEVRPIMVFE